MTDLAVICTSPGRIVTLAATMCALVEIRY